MKIHILGSGAAKPVPRPFCSCRGCRMARAEGGKSLRTRTSVSVYLGDDGPGTVRHKVDLGPDVADHQIRFGESLNALEHLLVTHAHEDHILPYWMNVRRQAISGTDDMTPLHLWGNRRVQAFLEDDVGIDFERNRIRFHLVEPGRRFQAGDLDVLPLLGMHPESEPSANFVITAEGKTVLMAWDTGFWTEETWQRAQGLVFDAVFMECTVNGPEGSSAGVYHHNVDSFLRMKQRMTDEHLLADDALFVSTHMGDNGQLSHFEAVAFWSDHGVQVAYDGMLTDLNANAVGVI